MRGITVLKAALQSQFRSQNQTLGSSACAVLHLQLPAEITSAWRDPQQRDFFSTRPHTFAANASQLALQSVALWPARAFQASWAPDTYSLWQQMQQDGCGHSKRSVSHMQSSATCREEVKSSYIEQPPRSWLNEWLPATAVPYAQLMRLDRPIGDLRPSRLLFC